ncbi:MAG: ferrous iron transport protein B [bacterium]
MKNLRILLVGQPNVGKSSLLNALVGQKVTVSNYPGTTVEITKARKKFNNTEIEFIDTPGIYSISDRSDEEEVTEKTLFNEELDGAIVLADATSLERSLYIVLQISESQIPVVLVLNFIEDAEKKGIKVDCEKLKRYLNIPVVSINPLTKRGISQLVDLVVKIKRAPKQSYKIEYDDHIEKVINKISGCIEGDLPKRFIALRILEEDKHFYRYMDKKKIFETVKEILDIHPNLSEDIAITRYGTASFIAREVTHICTLNKGKIRREGLDDVFLHKTFGPLATGLFFIVIFCILLYLGKFIQTVLMNITENLFSSSSMVEHSIVSQILMSGLTGLATGISIALPYVFLFYLLLGFLEDVGLLSRFIVNAERFLKKIRLPGKSFIPLLLGLGCTAPATRATRILSSKKEQIYTASLLAFVPCSSRIALIMGIVGFYGGTMMTFSVFATLFVAGLIWALGIAKIIHIEKEPLLLELPPYRRPLVKNIFAKSWLRMKDFVYIVVPLLILGGIAYGLLEAVNLTSFIVKPLSPITNWLGLPAETIVPLVFGFLQKDLTGAMLITVLGSDISTVLSPLQIYTFGTASAIGIPCIISLGILIREFRLKRALLLTAASIIYGILFAGVIWRIISVF